MALSSVRFFFLLFLLAPGNLPAQTFQELLRNGLLALQRDDLASAESNLRGAASLEPKNARAWVALAQTLRKRHQLKEAEEAAAKAREFAGGDSAVLRGLTIYDSESVAIYFAAAEPLLKSEQFGEAITMLCAAPAKVVEDAQIQLALGVAYYGLRRFDEAATAFLAVIAQDPAVRQPYLFLGKMLDQIPSRLDEVSRLAITYERTHPADPEGYLLHAKILDARGKDPETSRKLLEKVIAMEPSRADAHFELGSLLEKLQRYPEAAVEFERAAVLDPADAAVHYRLSRLYQRLNKPEAATAEREQHRKMVTAQNTAR